MLLERKDQPSPIKKSSLLSLEFDILKNYNCFTALVDLVRKVPGESRSGLDKSGAILFQ
jgi:hypothetical protein